MRGSDEQAGFSFSYVSCEARVPPDHPLRLIRAVVDEALEAMSVEFDRLYARVGRPSIAPEKLLRALLLQAFYGIRSERQLMEQMNYNMLFRWFVGLSMDAPVWDATSFSKNRERLLDGDVAQRFLAAVTAQKRVAALMSDEHFSVDGTLIQAWASHKSFQPKDHDDPPPPGTPPTPHSSDAKSTPHSGDAKSTPHSGAAKSTPRNGERDWRGQTRSNETHQSLTDPDARLARKSNGQASILAYAGHVLMENRHGLVSGVCLTRASGTAERDAALALIEARRTAGAPATARRITLGADKGYDAAAFITALRARAVTPHIAPDRRVSKTGVVRHSEIDGRTTRWPGYTASQRVRKRIEEVFGWIKTAAGLRQTKHRGLDRVGWTFSLAAAAYNLIRLPRLLAVR